VHVVPGDICHQSVGPTKNAGRIRRRGAVGPRMGLISL